MKSHIYLLFLCSCFSLLSLAQIDSTEQYIKQIKNGFVQFEAYNKLINKTLSTLPDKSHQFALTQLKISQVDSQYVRANLNIGLRFKV